MLDAALLAHFVSALTICKSKGITSNTFYLLVLTLDHKMSPALVALMPMKWTINPFFHLVKLILIAFCKSALSAIYTSQIISQFHLKCFESDPNAHHSICVF